MNDFTKDELIEIKSALSVFAGSPRGFKLFNKIQSLIDNHHECEMEYCGYVEATQCKECGKRAGR